MRRKGASTNKTNPTQHLIQRNNHHLTRDFRIVVLYPPFRGQEGGVRPLALTPLEHKFLRGWRQPNI